MAALGPSLSFGVFLVFSLEPLTLTSSFFTAAAVAFFDSFLGTELSIEMLEFGY